MEELIRTKSLLGDNAFNKLINKTVMVIGIGGVGGYVSEALARCGVKKLILVDYDIVEISNFNRQIIATYENLGKKKVECMKERIKSYNKNIEIVTIDEKLTLDNINFLWQYEVDFIVDAVDDKVIKQEIIKHSKTNQIDAITCLGTALKKDPSKLKITTLDKTNNDPLAKVLRKWAKENNYKKIVCCTSEEVPIKKITTYLPSMITVPASAGLLIASYVIEKLTK